MAEHTKPILESNHFIVLDKYTKEWEATERYQSEADLERELINDLKNQGYEFIELKNPTNMLDNVRVQLQALNKTTFSDEEWQRFVEAYLDKPSDTMIDKARKIHDDYIHDFVFDNGRIQNIYLLDKKNISHNKAQIIKQFEQTGQYTNRYDVTILVNGLPLVQIELKRRGVAIREAFNQIGRYAKESFNSDNSLYKYLQLFVISNGTDTRYFANTTNRDKNSFDFTMNWAQSDNSVIKDLKDFTATFLQKNTLLNVLIHYSVFDINNTLLIMRPYQIAATERILWKIRSTYEAKNWCKTESGGFIWHTTGSGKTLTSFKAARLITKLDFIEKVLFVVDRKDLDYQTMKEYQRFSPDSVNGSNDTAGLKRNLLSTGDNKITVTTIQKLNNLMKRENDLVIYSKKVVFIFDECHRSQFGETQRNLKKRFKQFCQFGFTGTPIFPDNARNAETTTTSVFGSRLHTYVITDAIRDKKVLDFKVDYNGVHPRSKKVEMEQSLEKLSTEKSKKLLEHPDRIKAISQHILNKFHHKTDRLRGSNKGFNAMFAVSNVEAAKLYYEMLNKLQKRSENPLKIATIFSYAANEEQDASGNIPDESLDISAMNSTAKTFLSTAINDYNRCFKTNFSVNGSSFQDYYRDLAKRVKGKDVDLLIVVGMFLTGFDAPTLNTLFVDKNLRYHGLIQAYSRTNRIYNTTKVFGNIITFRDLEKATDEAITLFGDKRDKALILRKSYQEYMDGFNDIITGKIHRGFITIVTELEQRFSNPNDIVKNADKKAFVKLFNEYLRVEKILKNYDEFISLKAFQYLDINNAQAVNAFKAKYHLQDNDLVAMSAITVPTERKIQNYGSTYKDIRDWFYKEKAANNTAISTIDWDDMTFEIELLKSLEINLDYILEQLFENNKKVKNKEALVKNTQHMIKASVGSRAKESLLIDFINQTNLNKLDDKNSIIDAFFTFAQTVQWQEAEALIKTENLNHEAAKRYIITSIKRGFASENGTDLNAILPKMSPLNAEYLNTKQRVFQKIAAFVEKFKGVGGQV